jgi:endoglucanase
MFDHDLNVPLLEALKLNVPEQTEYILRPDSTGFMIYTDYIGIGIYNVSYSDGLLDFYSGDQPNNDHFCLKWADASQYRQVSFDFKPDKDMSRLVSEGYALDMIVRTDIDDLKFDIRFIDTKTDVPDDHPWRMKFTIDDQMISPDSKWHHLFIPLTDFTEGGAWDDGWYNPEGKFDWTRIDRFEISNEYDILGQGKIWFDNIHTTNLDTAQIYQDSVFADPITDLPTREITTIKVFPNPAFDYLTVLIPGKSRAYVQLSDLRGPIVRELQFRGNGYINVSDLPGGMYILKITTADKLPVFYKIVKE